MNMIEQEKKIHIWEGNGSRAYLDSIGLTENEEDDGVIYGKKFTGDITPIAEIPEYGGKVIISGRVVGKETRELSSGKTLVEFYVADKTSAIICKAFMQPHIFEKVKPNLKKIKALTVQGTAAYDTFAKEVTISAQLVFPLRCLF